MERFRRDIYGEKEVLSFGQGGESKSCEGVRIKVTNRKEAKVFLVKQ